MWPFIETRGQRKVLVVAGDGAAEGVVAQVAHSTIDCEVVSACSGFEGLQKFENRVINIVLAGEKLVDMTGATFINIVKGLNKSKKKKPVCVLMAEKGRYAHGPDLDCTAAYDVIQSPVDTEELVYALDRAMDIDGLNGKIASSQLFGRVLLALIPVAVLVGLIIGL